MPRFIQKPSVVLMILTTILLLCVVQDGSAQRALENKLKAAFLLNFAKFTHWPDTVFNSPEFTFCAVGDSEDLLPYQGLGRKSVHGKSIQLVRLHGKSSPETCKVLFISQSSEEMANPILQKVDGKPILIVSDIESFSDHGGIIEFVTQGNRLGFIINNTRAGEIGLAINSSLLNLAAEVK